MMMTTLRTSAASTSKTHVAVKTRMTTSLYCENTTIILEHMYMCIHVHMYTGVYILYMCVHFVHVCTCVYVLYMCIQ